jgi:hypothetical protein
VKKPLKLLIVDDELNIRYSISQVLAAKQEAVQAANWAANSSLASNCSRRPGNNVAISIART